MALNNWSERYKKMLERGEGLFQKYPDALKEFVPHLNPNINICELTASSGKNVNWVCSTCRNEWEATPNNRFAGGIYRPCPKCSRKLADQKRRETAARKQGSIADSSEDIYSEWDWKKNAELDPKKISKKSSHNFWWLCASCGVSYQASASHRCVDGTGCRSCSFKKMGERYQKQAAVRNFFGAEYPALLEEWDYQKNAKPPESYSVSSNFSVHWKCRFGHEFPMGISHRTTRGQGCPECSLFGTSRNELRVYCEIKSQFKCASWRYRGFGPEVDIYIPDLLVGIEYDGKYWHSEKEQQDREKTELLASHNVKLMRLREFGLPLISEYCLTVPLEPLTLDTFKTLVAEIKKHTHKGSAELQFLLDATSFVAEDEFKTLLSRLPAPPQDESFASKCPSKLKYWDYEANFPLTPDLFLPRATYNAHWQCDICEFKFKKTLDQVYSNKYVCTHCAVKLTLEARVSNKKQSIKVLSVRPMLRNFILSQDLERLETLSPGSHQEINITCPDCKRQKCNTVKQIIKNKFLCRHCGIS